MKSTADILVPHVWHRWSAENQELVLSNHTSVLITKAGEVGLELQFTLLPLCHSFTWDRSEVLTGRLLVGLSCAPLVSSFTLGLACLLVTAISMHIKHDCEGPVLNLPHPTCCLSVSFCLSSVPPTVPLFILLFDFPLSSCRGCFDLFLLLGPLLFSQLPSQ